MKTRLWRFCYNGFHGRRWYAVRVPENSQTGDEIEMTDAQARHLRYCLRRDCQCGEGPMQQNGYGMDGKPTYSLILPEQGGTIRGHYPQEGVNDEM